MQRSKLQKWQITLLFQKNIIIFSFELIDKLQKEVWGHNNELETHTVETHIYRLRKKINDAFDNDDFIKSSKLGYTIK